MATEDKINAVIAQLETGVTTIPVSPFPDNPDAYMLKHKTGEVLVRYDGSNYLAPQSDNGTLQSQVVRIEVQLVMRLLKTNSGIYAYLDLIRQTLAGYQLSGHSKFYPVREGFVNEVNGIWTYFIDFECKTLYKGT